MSTAEEIEAWDAEADTFDEPADHGLRDPGVRAAWRRLLLDRLPAAPRGSLTSAAAPAP